MGASCRNRHGRHQEPSNTLWPLLRFQLFWSWRRNVDEFRVVIRHFGPLKWWLLTYIDLYVTYCWAPSSYMFFSLVNIGVFLYLFLCFICRVIILTASCFNHPRISHESVGLWSSWYIVSWTAVGFNAEKLHTFYRDQKNQKNTAANQGFAPKKSWNITVLMTKHFQMGCGFRVWLASTKKEQSPQLNLGKLLDWIHFLNSLVALRLKAKSWWTPIFCCCWCV